MNEINIKQTLNPKIEKILISLPKCIDSDGKGAIIKNYILLNLIIESLNHLLSLPRHLNYDEKRYLIEKSLISFAGYRKHTLGYFKKALNNTYRKEFSTTRKNFIIIFIAPSLLLRNLNLNGEIILLNQKLEISTWSEVLTKYDFDEFGNFLNLNIDRNLLYSKFQPIVMKVSSTNLTFKFEEHTKSFELFRAIINFSFHYGKFYYRLDLPANIFLPGFSTFIFNNEGEYLTSRFIYPDYKIRTNFSFSNKQKKLIKNKLEFFSQKDNKIKLNRYISNLLIRYSQSFDSFDYESIFIGLWIILERIAFPLGNSKIGDVPVRISKIIKFSEYSDYLIHSLTNLRNQTVHHGEFLNYYTNPVIFLKLIVENLIDRLISNPWEIEDLSEFEYLYELYKDKSNIDKKISFYKKYDSLKNKI